MQYNCGIYAIIDMLNVDEPGELIESLSYDGRQQYFSRSMTKCTVLSIRKQPAITLWGDDAYEDQRSYKEVHYQDPCCDCRRYLSAGR